MPRHAPKALQSGQAALPARRRGLPVARDRAIALLPLYAGTRIAEIAALDVADVQLSARKGELHLVGKGENPGTVPVHQSFQALAAWLAERPAKSGAGSAALFTSVRGTRMTTDALSDVIDRITLRPAWTTR